MFRNSFIYKRKVSIIFILIISSLVLISCGKNEEKEPLTEIEAGVYVGDANEETGFIPRLTLKDDKTYEFAVTKTFTYDGSYHVDDNKLILTISEERSYTFSKKGDEIALNEEVPRCIVKGTKFHLWGSFNVETVDKIEESTLEKDE